MTSSPTDRAASAKLGKRRTAGVVLGAAIVCILYFLYIYGLSSNPPGFYLDESAGSYNAYLLATTGASEFGDIPIYPKYYTGSRSEQGNPTHLYMLAAMYVFVPPSVVSARILAATTVFVACLLLGLLASRLSQRPVIGAIVALTAMLTPWLFDASRLVLEVFTYPLSVVLLLLSIYHAQKKARWSLRDHIFIALSLALVTYSYSVGRLLGPALAGGLLVFAVTKVRLVSVMKTWAVYLLTLVPLAFFMLTKPGALSKRFGNVTYLSWERPILDNVKDLFWAFLADISPQFLLYEGDPLLRHHVPGIGEILAATFVLAVVGLVIVIFRHWKDAWWQYVVFGLLVSVLPGAMTSQRFHSLRLSAFPVFLLVLTVPALSWLLGRGATQTNTSNANFVSRLTSAGAARTFGPFVLIVILALTAFQGYSYQKLFWEVAPSRGYVFDEAYRPLLARALRESSRPIYLEDGFWGPAYIHAYWYGTIDGVPLDNFVHLAEGQNAPVGGLVLSSNEKCSRCQIVERRGPYLLYRVIDADQVLEPPAEPTPISSTPETPDGAIASRSFTIDAKQPRGIAVDPNGNLYVTDAGNRRVLKLLPNGELLSDLSAKLPEKDSLREPGGIALDAGGDIFVTDFAANRLIRIKPDGSFVKSWDTFEAPIDVEFGADNRIYVADRGTGTIHSLDPETGSRFEWGSRGNEPGQFDSLTGLGSGLKNIFAADIQNDRIQVFSRDGTFMHQWSVPQWDKYIWHRPDIAVDRETDQIFVTNGWKNEVLVFDSGGNLLRTLKADSINGFNNVSALTIAKTKKGRFLYVLSTGGDVVDTGRPSIAEFQLPLAE